MSKKHDLNDALLDGTLQRELDRPVEELVEFVADDSDRPKAPFQQVNGSQSFDLSRFSIISLADAVPTPPEFWWHPYIPQNRLMLVEGRPGVSKTEVLMFLVSQFIQPGFVGYPDAPGAVEHDPVNVLIMTPEADAGELRHRLDRYHLGTPARAMLFEGERHPTYEGATIGMTLDRVEELAQIVRQLQARVLILDPVNAFLPDRTDSNNDKGLRRILDPLNTMAMQEHCTVVMVRHWRKGAGGEASEAGVGSVAYMAVARSAVAIAAHPDDKDGPRRVLVHTKCNNARLGQSVEFQFVEGGGVEWVGMSDVTSSDIMDPTRRSTTPKVQDAIDKLHGLFGVETTMPSRKGFQAMKELGFGRDVTEKALDQLGISVVGERDEAGLWKSWSWVRP